MLEALAGMSAYFYVMYQGGWSWAQPLASTTTLYLQATTACLAGVIATQIANALACRSSNVSILTLGIFSNRLLLAGIATDVLLAVFIIYTPIGNSLFASAPIGADVWLLLIPFAILLLVIDESRKYFVRRRILKPQKSDWNPKGGSPQVPLVQ